jgi:cyclopropane fatty-acyl-phospholipid synthase-like methyltransferase
LKKESKVLDLGCGKGAVLIKIVKEFKCHGHGIDALPDFIEEANKYAQSNKVIQNCKFEIGDIRRIINNLTGYDLVILGSIGPVFGDIQSTLLKVQTCLSNDGYIILDDGYLSNDSTLKSQIYFKEKDVLQQIESAGMKIIDEIHLKMDDIRKSNKHIYENIQNRVKELKKKYPRDHSIFDGYLKSQEEENTLLEEHINCVTWLLAKKLD